MISLRASTCRLLRVTTGRWVDTERQDRTCEHCDSGEVDDEVHFLTRCTSVHEEREFMWRQIGKVFKDCARPEDIRGKNAHRQVARWLLGMKDENKQVRKVVLRGVHNMAVASEKHQAVT